MADIFLTRGYLAQAPFMKPTLFTFYDPINRETVRRMYAIDNKLRAIMEGFKRAFSGRGCEVIDWDVKDKTLTITLKRKLIRLRKSSIEKVYTVLYTFDSRGDENSWCTTLGRGYVSTETQHYKDAQVIYLTSMTRRFNVVVKCETGEVLYEATRNGQSETNVSPKATVRTQSHAPSVLDHCQV